MHTHHPYLVSYAFYTTPIFPIFIYYSPLVFYVCMFEPSVFVVVVDKFDSCKTKLIGLNPIALCKVWFIPITVLDTLGVL